MRLDYLLLQRTVNVTEHPQMPIAVVWRFGKALEAQVAC